MLNRLICLILGYFIGAIIQTGFWIGKFNHIDIRDYGSGNAGTTNTMRTLGKKAGFITYFMDAFKSCITALIIHFIYGSNADISEMLLILYGGFGVVLGHNFPFYLGFKGGKGIAATSGLVISLILFPKYCFMFTIFGPQVSDFEELLARLQAEGFTIKRGKYVSCLVPGQERFTRLKTLGADYTEEAIRERIEGKRTRTAKAPKTERGVSLLIDIENSIKAAQSRGYEQWAKIHNLKQAAKTMNFITEHKIEQYTDLTAKIAEIQTESEQAADALKSAEKRLVDMAVLIKNVSTFQKTKPAYDAYRKARNKDSYRAAHEREIILHEAAAKALKAAGVSKLPNLTALQSEYEKLQEQKEALYADYGRLKKQVKEYDVIKQNIDSILRQPREPEREKGKERGE